MRTEALKDLLLVGLEVLDAAQGFFPIAAKDEKWHNAEKSLARGNEMNDIVFGK